MGALLEGLSAGPSTSRARTGIVRYRHWDTGGPPDVAFEAGRCEIGTDDLVVAKSMGTMVLLEAVALGQLPAEVVLIGTPVKGYSDTQVAQLKALAAACPCLFIQQSDDFTGSHAELVSVLGSEPGAAVIRKVDGSDHIYADTDELVAIIEEWRQRAGADRG